MLDISTLNNKQSEAVTTTEGPVLVLAGAGSGKTRVLTYRIAYILDAGLAGPFNILAMTFTNKAAREMGERVEHLVQNVLDTQATRTDNPTKLSWLGTFHSICVKMLKQHGEHVGLGRNFTIYDSGDQLQTIKDAMKARNYSIKEFKPYAIKSYISSAKNELITPIEYESYAQGYFQQVVSDVYYEYQNQLSENNAVDFDDLIMLTIRLFETNKQILKKYQHQFKYILVDEYQDTNHAQYKMIKMLATEHKNICCVGDDDQSIYAFRGATIKNILNFEKDYKETVTVKLEQNYRSTKTILEAAYQVISKNKGRKDKKLWTDNDNGKAITLFNALDEQDEGNWITSKIEGLKLKDNNNESKHKSTLDDVAILYRTNAQSRALEEAFLEAAVPYRIVGGVRFYDRKEIKDLVSYLKVLFNPKDTKSLDRIINVPRRGIGAKGLLDLKAEAKRYNCKLGEFLLSTEYEVQGTKYNDLKTIFEKLGAAAKEKNIVELINYVLEETGYLKMLDDGTSENQARIENLKELISVASKYLDDGPQGLEAFLDEISLLEGLDEGQDDKERVTLMTIHASKGLEFKHVFIAGAEESLFPHSNSMENEKDLEEERRLAYVAITRAKEHLYITHTQSRLYFGQTQRNALSRFIKDIDDQYLEYKISDYILSYEDQWDKPNTVFNSSRANGFSTNAFQVDLVVGDKVKHDYFGVGTVAFLNDEVIEVDFGAVYGVKELMLEYAKLTKV